MPFDPAQYLCYVDALDLSHERKIEMIHVVASIMESFVDRAFGTSPEQTLLGTSDESGGTDCPLELEWQLLLPSTFNEAARADAARKSPP